ncbi:MAG TPA: phosphatase PAP2 family protein [Vicinamibacterales bacterium]|nr:phosphatase PAP2 family protein [Vicinamibacterales bacterium]
MTRSFTATRGSAALVAVALCATVASAQGTAPSTSTPEQAEAPCNQYGISTVVRCMGHDLVRVAQGDSLRWLLAGGALAGGSLFVDDEIAAALASPTRDSAVVLGDHLGHAGVQFAIPGAMYLIGRAAGHDGTADLGIMLVRTQVVNGIFTRALKLIPRARPYQDSATPGQGSFPSGHASASFATATVFQRKWGWRAGVPAYAVATFISVTRLQNMHFLSDVTFGAALGIASGLAINVPGQHSAVAPIVAPGVVGVSVTIGGDR